MSSRPRVGAALAAVLVVLSLAACASGPSGDNAANVTTPSVTPSQTPAASPTPDPTSTPAPSAPAKPMPTPIAGPAGTIAFGGTCANALSVADAAELTGQQMAASYGSTGASNLAAVGGIRCFWDSTAYLHAEILVDVYPTDAVPVAARNPSCDVKVEACALTVTVGPAWLRISASGDGKNTQVLQQAVLEGILPRLAAFPGPAAPHRDSRWWKLPECDLFLSGVDQPSSGFEQIMLDRTPDENPAMFLPHDVARTCSIVGMGGVAKPYNEPMLVTMTAGGAKGFPVGSDVIKTLTVRGATQAVFAHLPSPIEPGPDMLVATDGVNLLQIVPDGDVDPATLTGIAGSILAGLATTVH